MNGGGDPASDFRDAMARLGIVLKGMPIGDGRLHRFDVEGDRQGSKNGYYTLHLDGRPAGAFGCWKRGIKETWKANGAPLSDFDLSKLMRGIEAERKRREREEAKRHKEVADDAASLWSGYEPAPSDHTYLARKQVHPLGAKVDSQGRLVVPLADVAGEIWSLQTIDEDGGKLFMPGGRKRGCMFDIGDIGDIGDRIVIAEGFATAASIHEATGLFVAVAFDAGNLESVAQAIRAKWPKAQIVVAADDDRETDGNPGLTAARKAAKAVGATVAIPVRSQPDGRKLDFNDLHVAEGSEAVATIIARAFPDLEDEPQPDPAEDASGEAAAAEAHAAAADDDWEERLDAGVDELNGPHFVAAMGGSVRIASVAPDPAQEDRERLTFSRPEDIKLLYAHRHYKTGVSQKGHDIRKGLGEAWLTHPRRRTYSQIALIPDGPCPPDVFNLWRGFGVEPKAGDWSTIQDHLWSVICSRNQTNYDWLIDWLAYCVQYPGKQAEAAVVLRGLKGTGKGMLGQILIRIFLSHSLHITQSKHLVGHFNAHLVDALFLFLDEAFWAGDKAGEGVLKALITERTLMIEPKGVDSFQMPNRLKILMASNNEWVVPASADERRYFVLDVSDCRKSDKAYFGKLAAAIEGDELAAFLDYLLKLDLADFDHRNPPHTDGLNKQKLISGDSLRKFWLDCLTNGRIDNAALGDDWPDDIVCHVLYDAYKEYVHDLEDRYPLTSQLLGTKLRELCPDGKLPVVRPQKQHGDDPRPRRYVLPKLDKAREAFLKAMDIEAHEWPEVEGEPKGTGKP